MFNTFILLVIPTLSSNISTENVENFAIENISPLLSQRMTENKDTQPSILNRIDPENRKKFKQGVTQRRIQEKDNQRHKK